MTRRFSRERRPARSIHRSERSRRTPTCPPTTRCSTDTSRPTPPAIPDEYRADIFLREFAGYVQRGNLPNLVIMELPDDHTSGTAPGRPTPRAQGGDASAEMFRTESFVPDQQNPQLLNRAICYSLKGYTTPYPGDDKVLTPDEARAGTEPLHNQRWRTMTTGRS